MQGEGMSIGKVSRGVGFLFLPSPFFFFFFPFFFPAFLFFCISQEKSTLGVSIQR